MFNKLHIKPGMLVELLDFEELGLYYVTLCEKGMILINNNGYYANLKDFNDDLSHKRLDSIKILKVYGLSEYENYSLKFSTRYRELLWNREDQVNWNEVKVDTKVLVRNNPNAEWKKDILPNIKTVKYMFMKMVEQVGIIFIKNHGMRQNYIK